jgi:tetratricopeptide (TPR) repeat protein
MAQQRRIMAALLGLVLMLGASVRAEAQAQARVVCEVTDENGRPLPGVRITATTRRTTMARAENTTGSDGRCIIPLIDGTWTYDLVLEKDGYQKLEVNLKIPFGTTAERRFMLASHGSGRQSTISMPEEDRQQLLQGEPALLRYNEAVEAEAVGDLDTALDRLRAAAKLDHTHLAARILLADIALRLGHISEAATAAEEAVALDAQCLDALYLRYEAYRQLGDEEQTRAAAEALLSTGDPNEGAARVFNTAVADYNRGRLQRAETSFQLVLQLDSGMVNAYFALANIYTRQGRPQQAVAMADEVLKRAPDNLAARKMRYLGLRESGDTATAHQALVAISSVDPEWAAPDLYNHASKLYNSGHQVEAGATLDWLLELLPDNPAAHYLRGLCCDRAGDHRCTRKHLQRFLELAPDHADAATARKLLGYLDQGTADHQDG